MEHLEELKPIDNLEHENAANAQKREEEYRGSKLRTIGYVVFGVAAFVFFLLMKLPEARIQNLVLAHLRIFAQEQGLLFSAEKVRIGILLGPSLKLYNIELKSIDDERHSIKMPYLKLSPHLLSLLTGTKKVGVAAELLDGSLSGSAGFGTNQMSIDLDLDDLNLEGTRLMRKFLAAEFGGILNGRIKLDLNQEIPVKSEGYVKLTLEKAGLPAQNVYGFNLPKINISKTEIDLTIKEGQIAIKNFEVGKDPKSDDIVAKVTGEGTLDRRLEYTKVNGKVVFQISNGVSQSFPLLDALLGPARTPDGKYSYHFNGPIMSLEPQPGG